MDRGNTARRLVIAVAATSLLLSGCGTTGKVGEWLRGGDEDPGEVVIIGAPDADSYLSELFELSAGDERKQANIVEDAEAAARLTPGPSSNLRLALVLGTPGHAGFDPVRSTALLRAVLDQQPLLTSAETSLATIYLNNVEGLGAASREASRVRSASDRAARATAQATTARISDLESENERLRQELADAEQKLEAITSIERSIRQQE